MGENEKTGFLGRRCAKQDGRGDPLCACLGGWDGANFSPSLKDQMRRVRNARSNVTLP